MNIYERNELYWGEIFQNSLKNISVAIFGLGGVGGFALEALLRVGVGNFTLVDFDKISSSNINRQIIANNTNIGEFKTYEWEKRSKLINSDVNLKIFNQFYEQEDSKNILTPKPDFIIDAIDTIKSKISLIKFATDNNINIITSLGAGNRIDASKLRITDISDIKTNCNFAKNIIRNLKNNGIERNLPCIISDEKPKNLKKHKTAEKIQTDNGEIEFTKYSPASISTVPAVCGYLAANYVILNLYNNFIQK